MKNILLAICVIAFTITSCSKKQIQTSTTTTPLPTSAKYFYQDKQVFNQEEITTEDISTKVALFTDKIDGTPSYYFFDDIYQVQNFTANNESLKEAKTHVDKYIQVREYAKQINEDAYAEKYGKSSEKFAAFLNTVNPKKRLIQGTMYMNVAYGGAAVDKIAGLNIFPALFPAHDNNIESVRYAGPGVNPYTLCNGINGAAPFLIVNANNPFLLMAQRNITTSVF